jgi:5-methylcytosine-specific restriction endonuclease McrA
MSRGPRNGAVYRRVAQEVCDAAVRCGLCGGLLNKALRYPHPYSTVCDHIITLDQGGDLLDRNNLQGAHKVCNERKGAARAAARAGAGPRNSREW